MKKLRLHTAVAIVVANMVGTGVFTSLGFQVVSIHSVFTLLMLWFVGGVIALCGAFSYGELAASMPRSGGEYHFLSEIYHPAVGFLSGWVSASVGFAAPTALAAMAFGKYLKTVFPHISEVHFAAGAVILITLVHAKSVYWGSRFHNLFTLVKILLVIVFILSAFFVQSPQPISIVPEEDSFMLMTSPSFAVSLIYVSYAYTGWNAAVYVTSEIEEPQKNLPKALFIGTLIVLVMYVLLNFVFLYTVDMNVIKGQIEVGFFSAKQIFGTQGADIMSITIALLLISTMSAMIFVGPRITKRMGEDFKGLSIFARTNAEDIPIFSMLFQTCLTLLFIYTSSFNQVLTYASFALISVTSLTVLGVFILRIRKPHLPRPYKVWGYPITPMIFLLLNIWTLVFVFENSPKESSIGIGIMLLGLFFYFLSAKKK
ncbi:MAG: amino acid permease [Thermoflexibacter sp.]|jgi:APA family basic amino acid/polyamine antiporter|nr:amino acid permease [Thermoflexibacter sp.]